MDNQLNKSQKKRFFQKKWFKITAIIIVIIILAGGFFAWKTGHLLNKISGGGVFSSLVHAIPGVEEKLKGQEEDRINVLILGMRGENMVGGGLLTDVIQVVSLKPIENKISFISIPRDLYVTVPGTQDKQKINAVHHYGEQKGQGKGLEDMKTVVSEITGLPIHYAASINFDGFKQLIDTIGGIELTLEQPFQESQQFHEPHVCDSYVFTVPMKNAKNQQMYECKYGYKLRSELPAKTSYTAIPPATCYNEPGKKGYYVRVKKAYPLCYNDDEECGGNFQLPAGTQTLNGDKTLCYVRSRATSSDFERSKRQQIIIQLIKDKMLSLGTLTDFSKINGILESLGNNARTDMQLWEMQKGLELYKNMQNPQIYQRVLENSEEGLLYHPEEGAAGYILLPIGDNYDKIREMAKNIFILPTQSDIKPK